MNKYKRFMDEVDCLIKELPQPLPPYKLNAEDMRSHEEVWDKRHNECVSAAQWPTFLILIALRLYAEGSNHNA